MTLFLILLPFAAFSGMLLVASPVASTFVAAAIALAVILRDVTAGRSLKTLAAGSAAVFLGLGCYILLVDPQMSATAARIAVDAGVLAIAVASLAVGAPFSLQYGREMVDAETARLPGFHRANIVITLVWIAAFILMLIANMLTVYLPTLPLWVALAIAVVARNAAALFTRWYPAHRRSTAAPRSLTQACPETAR